MTQQEAEAKCDELMLALDTWYFARRAPIAGSKFRTKSDARLRAALLDILGHPIEGDKK